MVHCVFERRSELKQIRISVLGVSPPWHSTCITLALSLKPSGCAVANFWSQNWELRKEILCIMARFLSALRWNFFIGALISTSLVTGYDGHSVNLFVSFVFLRGQKMRAYRPLHCVGLMTDSNASSVGEQLQRRQLNVGSNRNCSSYSPADSRRHSVVVFHFTTAMDMKFQCRWRPAQPICVLGGGRGPPLNS